MFEKSIGENGLNDKELETLADLTGEKHNNGLAFSFSDIRLRVLPEAVSKCFPSKALDFESVKETIIQFPANYPKKRFRLCAKGRQYLIEPE